MTTRDTSRSTVSLMIPALNEEDSAALVVGRLDQIRKENPAYAFDVVLVDDGSTDHTADVFAKELDSAGFPFVILQFSRNFGSHAAITAAVDTCRSDAAITLSADLQEPSSLVRDMLDAWESGSDVVWAVRGDRVDAGKTESGAAKGFSKLLAENSEIPNYPGAGPSQVLLSRAVLAQLRTLRESNRNILGLIAWLGFPQSTVSFQQESRAVGTSRWNNAKRAKLAVDSFVGHSRAPLRMVLIAAMGTGVLALLLWIATLVAVFTGAAVAGWAVSASVFTVTSVQLCAISVLGAYVWRGGYDARSRPVYVVSRTLRDSRSEHE
ncbi:MAG: glycosyltransferase family 2 protein [Actinobacteria bacterium]|nr:glycosyltransferase family 2 protein [Actinomycetota bacterium]